jgi:hypothetical protein
MGSAPNGIGIPDVTASRSGQRRHFLKLVRSRLNAGAWTILILVIIELLSSRLSKDLSVTRIDLVLVGLFVTLMVASIIFWTINRIRWLRRALFFLNGLFTFQLLLACILIVVRLLQNVKIPATVLIVDVLIIAVNNVLIFSLWYWFIDAENARFFGIPANPAWDFLFPQRQANYPGYAGWQPSYLDYLFLAFTTSVAFSPTDTLPLSRAAKLLMMTQATIAVIAITAVAGTAINVLAGGA